MDSSQQNFTLRDNGQLANIVSFKAFDAASARPDFPVEVILVIDALNMPEVQLAAAEHEAENFLRQNQGHLRQPVTIYRLDKDGLSASTQASTDGNLLAGEITRGLEPRWVWKNSMVAKDIGKFNLNRPRSLPPLHSLIALGSIAIEQRRRPSRKLMFWLGPGWQFESNQGTGVFDFATELFTRLREARIDLWSATEWPFYDRRGTSLPVNHFIYKEFLDAVTPDKVDFRYLTLQVIASRTGGGSLETPLGLGDLIGKQADQANSFYSLTFDPPHAAGVDQYHRLQVQIDQPNLTAHTSTGYFDEPVFYDQPCEGIERVSVEQLEQILSAAQGRPDAEVTNRLSGMELTERLNSAKLATLGAALKGKKARQALVALADQSIFLPPPAAEIPSTAPPDTATQRMMLGRTIAYVVKTIPTLPDFFATRTINQYHERPPKPGQTWKTAMGDRSLHLVDTSKATLHFRSGKEVVEGEVVKQKRRKGGNRMMLATVGTFGPILAAVLQGATSPGSELFWSHWEKSPNGPLAVFRYRVPKETPLFLVGADYLVNGDTAVPFEKQAPFHGEIAINPASGAILRLTMLADLEPRLPLERSNVMVEYGPVAMAGNTYICPARAVSVSRQRRIMDIHEWSEDFKVYAAFETILSDMTYTKYHKFHSTSRILPGYIPAPNSR